MSHFKQKYLTYLLTNIFKSMCLIVFSFFAISCSKIDGYDSQKNYGTIFALPQDVGFGTPPKQQITMPALNTNGWKLAYTDNSLSSPMAIYAKDKSFDESIRIMAIMYKYNRGTSLNKFYDADTSHIKNTCQSYKIKLLDKTTQYLLYQTMRSGCKRNMDQFQVTKAFAGSDAIYYVSYTAKTGKISNRQIQQQIENVSQAHIIANSRKTRSFEDWIDRL